MKFILTKSSDWIYKGEVKFNDLKSLIKWVDTLNEKIIIYPKKKKNERGEYEIEIYDFWRE